MHQFLSHQFPDGRWIRSDSWHIWFIDDDTRNSFRDAYDNGELSLREIEAQFSARPPGAEQFSSHVVIPHAVISLELDDLGGLPMYRLMALFESDLIESQFGGPGSWLIITWFQGAIDEFLPHSVATAFDTQIKWDVLARNYTE